MPEDKLIILHGERERNQRLWSSQSQGHG